MMLPLTDITIHCAATPEGRDVKAAQISEWDRAKFGQVSYHAVCELDGTIVETLPDTTRGAHTGGHNTGNLGLCYVGGMDERMAAPKDTRTPAQKAAMARWVRDKLAKYPSILRVRGHRDWPGVQKACPSFAVAAWLAEEGIVVGGGVTAPRTLRKGDTGPDVVALQQQLARHGRSINLTVDGSFGAATEAAVKAFQSAHGLVADGIVGSATRTALAKE